MQTFKEIFEAYGADYETTMERFMGSEETYREFLDMFCLTTTTLPIWVKRLNPEILIWLFEAAHTPQGRGGEYGVKASL